MDKDKIYDWLTRALWTAIYVFVAAFLSTAGGTDLTTTSALRAAGLAALLAVAKSLVVGVFGDPNKIRSTLADMGLRAFHTFWQTFAALIIVTDFSAGALKIAAISAAVNTLKGVVFPPSIPGAQYDDGTPLDEEPAAEDVL